jgi:hypothetical protein
MAIAIHNPATGETLKAIPAMDNTQLASVPQPLSTASIGWAATSIGERSGVGNSETIVQALNDINRVRNMPSGKQLDRTRASASYAPASAAFGQTLGKTRIEAGGTNLVPGRQIVVRQAEEGQRLRIIIVDRIRGGILAIAWLPNRLVRKPQRIDVSNVMPSILEIFL